MPKSAGLWKTDRAKLGLKWQRPETKERQEEARAQTKAMHPIAVEASPRPVEPRLVALSDGASTR